MWFLYDEEDDSDYKEEGDGGDSDVEDDCDKEVMRDGQMDGCNNPEPPPALSPLLCLCLPLTTALVLSIGWLVVYKLISASRFDAVMKCLPCMPLVPGPDTGGSDNREI